MGSGDVTFGCKEGDCTVKIQGTANTHVDCPGGGCKVSVLGAGSTEVRCPGGKCTLDCTSPASCTITECPSCGKPPNGSGVSATPIFAGDGGGPNWGAAKGKVAIERGDGKNVKLAVDQCWSGQNLSFQGVEFFQEPNIKQRVRVVEHPVDGQRIVLIGLVPGNDRVILEPKSCVTFSAKIERTRNTLNRIWSLRGSVVLDCDRPEGHITANVTLEQCAYDNRAKSL